MSVVWKKGDGWVQHNPPAHHPCREEWLKQKEKEKSYDEKCIEDS
jgi:hypothetical protein